MKRILLFLLMAVTALCVAACGASADTAPEVPEKNAKAVSEPKAKEPVAETIKNTSGKKILVAYFSRTGDNYQVGYIEKGNTHIMADMIAETVGADTFEIKTVKAYPENYRECTEVAAKDNARPELVGKVANWEDYDTVFLGYPIWWSDLPMAVYTFMESYDWTGKTVIPFCTSAGDVLTGRESDIPQFAKGATLKEGLGLEGKRVQERPESAKPEVEKWLKDLGYGGR